MPVYPRDGFMPTATALVVASDAPPALIAAAMEAKDRLGDLIQICDGIDDHLEIQAAIDALPAGGGSMKVVGGKVTLSTSLAIDGFLSGDGGDKHLNLDIDAVVVCPSTAPAIIIGGTSEVRAAKIRVAKIDGVDKASGRHGIEIRFGRMNQITVGSIVNCDYGIYLGGGSNQVGVVADNSIYFGQLGYCNSNIVIEGKDATTHAQGNTFYGGFCQSAVNYGLHLKANCLYTRFYGSLDFSDVDLQDDVGQSIIESSFIATGKYAGAGLATSMVRSSEISDLSLSTVLTQGRYLQVPTNSGWTEAVTGSGATGQLPMFLYVKTGTTANSSALLRALFYGYCAYNAGRNTIDLRKRWHLKFTVARVVSESETVCYFQLKSDTTHGNLTDLGMGIKLANMALYLESHDGTTRTETSANTTLSDGIPVWIDIFLTPGVSLDLFVNGDRKVHQTSNVPNANGTVNFYTVASIGNGATGGTNTELHVDSIGLIMQNP